MPSSLRIDDAQLHALRRRLDASRWPTEAMREPWADGVDVRLIRHLAQYWSEQFDWRARESSLNRYRHTWTSIDGLGVHSMISEPRHPGPVRLPVLALHGWPSTFEQMTRLADNLGAPDIGMTTIAPSLPGFGFSDVPTEPGWGLWRTADVLHRLMTEHFGHQRYLVRGTDYGLAIALHLGARHPRHVAGVHIGGMHLTVPDDAHLPADLTADEEVFVGQARAWRRDESAYADVHATKPETLAVALADSPVGLLAWIVEKYRTWCAQPQDMSQIFAEDDLLSTATIYWATNTVASSMRLYREDRLERETCPDRSPPRSLAPVAINQPMREEYRVPRSWWLRLQPVARHTLLPDAGHFPEWENPQALAVDIAEFAESVWERPDRRTTTMG